jgi:glycosyltransferase involved in cell wall biosynthesis
MAFDGSVNGGQRLPAVREGPIPLERRPTVTVVIPCYNYARYLRESVSSALGQSEVDVDVVIVDDASTDDSQAVAQELAQRDPRVTVLAHHRNLGPVQTFNAGLARASGEFVARLDADDLLTNGSLGRAAAVMTRHPEVGLVYGHPIHFAPERSRRVG